MNTIWMVSEYGNLYEYVPDETGVNVYLITSIVLLHYELKYGKSVSTAENSKQITQHGSHFSSYTCTC